jgi:hypothetical protein
MSSINYKQPLEDDAHFQEYLKSKEATLRKKNKASRPQSTHMWALVFVLMVSLVGLGITALLQYRETQVLLAQYSDVAGVSDVQEIRNTITAEGFSIVLDEETPEGYVVTRSTGESDFVEGVTSVTTSFLAELENDQGDTVLSGIEVEVIEYDNRLNQSDFAESVVEELGENYSIVAGEIELPKDFAASIIRNTSDTTDGIDYHTAVTSSNYYVIKVYTQSSPFPELVTYTRFSDSLLGNLYLN